MTLKEKRRCHKCVRIVEVFNFNRMPMTIKRCPNCGAKMEVE